jgi:hypothetical protein
MSFLNLLDLSGKAKPKKHRVYVNPVYDEKRDSYVEGLYNTWEQVSTREDPYLNAASFTTSGIKCHNLLKESSFDEAPNGPKFFREMPHGKLQEYKVITDDKDTMRDLCVEKKLWLSKEENLCNELHPLGLAETICNALQLAFDTHRRMTSDGQKVTLMQTTGWKRAYETHPLYLHLRYLLLHLVISRMGFSIALSMTTSSILSIGIRSMRGNQASQRTNLMSCSLRHMSMRGMITAFYAERYWPSWPS